MAHSDHPKTTLNPAQPEQPEHPVQPAHSEHPVQAACLNPLYTKQYSERPFALEDHLFGPEAGTKLASLSDFADHGGLEVTLGTGPRALSLLLQIRANTVHAFENRCPHAGTPLNLSSYTETPSRFLSLDGRSLVCQTHGAHFTLETGLCTYGPCKGRSLRPVLIYTDGNDIYSGPRPQESTAR